MLPVGMGAQGISGPVAANSLKRHNALASRICLGVRHSGSNNASDATTIAAHLARDVATFSRFRLYRNSIPLGASSGCEVAIE